MEGLFEEGNPIKVVPEDTTSLPPSSSEKQKGDDDGSATASLSEKTAGSHQPSPDDWDHHDLHESEGFVTPALSDRDGASSPTLHNVSGVVTPVRPSSIYGESDVEPTKEELETLRHIGGKVSWEAWLIAISSGAERFAFYALQTPLQNYVQNPAHDFGRPGALGLGQSAASALNSTLKLIGYTTPMFAGILADGHWGPYKTLVVSYVMYLCGILLLMLTSIPAAIDAGAGLGGLCGAIVLIGLGIGGVKSSIAPFTADQVKGSGKKIAILKSGERVVVDHEITVRRVYSIFYWATNVGALSGVISTTLEKYVGFWSSFLAAWVALAFGTVALIVGRKNYYIREPSASFRAQLFSALGCAIKGGFKLDAAEPAYQLEHHGRSVPWDEQFVDDMRQAFQACKYWTLYPIVWLCCEQNQTNLVSQAAQMITYGIPNDALATLNPIFVLMIVPVFEHWLYPWMHRIGMHPRATVRTTLGFGFVAAGMALTAGVQQVIYNSGPCYDFPLQCAASNSGSLPNTVSVWLQAPPYFVNAIGEVLFSVAGSEYAYNKAAPHMKSTIQAITMLTIAINDVLGLAVSPAAHNPFLVVYFASFAGAMALTTGVFAYFFWSKD